MNWVTGGAGDAFRTTLEPTTSQRGTTRRPQTKIHPPNPAELSPDLSNSELRLEKIEPTTIITNIQFTAKSH